MDFDFGSLLEQLKNLDTASIIVGSMASPLITKIIVETIKPIPGLIVRRIDARIQKLHKSGKLDDPTLRLLDTYARATFAWVDAELPDNPGPKKMDALLDRLSLMPYIGFIVRADREHAREILQVAYNAIDDAAKKGLTETEYDESSSPKEEKKEKTG